MYIDRNILPFLPSLILVTGVVMDSIFNRLDTRGLFGENRNRIAMYLILIAIVFLPVWIFSKNYFKTVFPSAKSNIERRLASIEDSENRRLLTIDYDPGTASVNYTSVEELPSFPETYGTMLKDAAMRTSNEFSTTDVVVLTEIKNNKQQRL